MKNYFYSSVILFASQATLFAGTPPEGACRASRELVENKALISSAGCLLTYKKNDERFIFLVQEAKNVSEKTEGWGVPGGKGSNF